MAERLEVYKCDMCGNIIEVLHGGAGELVCCGEPMNLMEVKTQALEGKEKHVPVVERTDKGVIVKVGSIPHPMEEKHYIEWIQVVTDSKVLRKFLNPGEVPEAEFETSDEIMYARELCNIHGLWIDR
ncbi:MAG: desulfoferrodoxin [Methanobacteriota archaeon]|nr:MAG: desulfoferrodoxin [Euryarchaeota archaeon]